MPSARSAEQSRLGVAERVCRLVMDRGYGLTVAQICDAVGVPQRTFYNYFPTKADVIRPVLDHGLALFVEAVSETERELPLSDALVAGMRESIWGPDAVYSRRLVRLVLEVPALNAVWLSTIRDSEEKMADVLRARTGFVPGSLEERMAAAGIVGAVRISFEYAAAHDIDPVVAFRAALQVVSISPATLSDSMPAHDGGPGRTPEPSVLRD